MKPMIVLFLFLNAFYCIVYLSRIFKIDDEHHFIIKISKQAIALQKPIEVKEHSYGVEPEILKSNKWLDLPWRTIIKKEYKVLDKSENTHWYFYTIKLELKPGNYYTIVVTTINDYDYYTNPVYYSIYNFLYPITLSADTVSIELINQNKRICSRVLDDYVKTYFINRIPLIVLGSITSVIVCYMVFWALSRIRSNASGSIEIECVESNYYIGDNTAEVNLQNNK